MHTKKLYDRETSNGINFNVKVKCVVNKYAKKYLKKDPMIITAWFSEIEIFFGYFLKEIQKYTKIKFTLVYFA